MKTKTIEQLEKNIWEQPNNFPSPMVEKCYEYRKIIIADLSIAQLRLLISQQIGLEFLIPIAIEKLEENVLAEGDYYEGDLLMTTSKLPSEFWEKHKNEFQKLKNIISHNNMLIKNELGEKDYYSLLSKF